MDSRHSSKYPIAILVGTLILLVCYWELVLSILANLGQAISPLVLGAIIAYIVNIPMSFYERHLCRSSRSTVQPLVYRAQHIACLVAAIITIGAIVSVVVMIVAPELLSSVRSFGLAIPRMARNLIALLEDMPFRSTERIQDMLESVNWQQLASNVLSALGTGVGGTLSLIADTLSAVASLLVAVVFALYILLGKQRLIRQFYRMLHVYLTPVWEHRVRLVLTTFNDSFHRFIVGQCVEAVILGTLCAIGMSILRMPYAVMTGTVVGATALIPVIGAYVGGAVGCIFVLTQSPIQALVFLIFLVVLQQLEGDVIYPRVVGSSIGLPGIWVLAAVTIGGGVAGVVGMLFGVPCCAAIYRLLRRDIMRREAQEEGSDLNYT